MSEASSRDLVGEGSDPTASARRFGPALAHTNFNTWPDVHVVDEGEARMAHSRPDAHGATMAFEQRFGAVLTAGHVNAWPHVLLRTAPHDRLPHWQRIGLEPQELLFILVLLADYHRRRAWPSPSIAELARLLDLSERRVSQIKSALCGEGPQPASGNAARDSDGGLARMYAYLRRRPRFRRGGDPSGGNVQLSDELDLSPLFALLEACMVTYHARLVPSDVQPIWLGSSPGVRVDPDAFGAARRAQRDEPAHAGTSSPASRSWPRRASTSRRSVASSTSNSSSIAATTRSTSPSQSPSSAQIRLPTSSSEK
jgi:hypothetical protein